MAEKTIGSVEELRAKIDGDTRFKRVMRGYDPDDVNAYIAELKNELKQSGEMQSILAKSVTALEQNMTVKDAEIDRMRVQESENAARVSRAAQTIMQLKSEVEAAHALAGETEPLRREIGDLHAQIAITRGDLEREKATVERLNAEIADYITRAERAESELKANRLDMIECIHMLNGIQSHTASVLANKLNEVNRLISSLQEEAVSTSDALKRKMSL